MAGADDDPPARGEAEMTVAPESCEIVDLVREPGGPTVLMTVVRGELRRVTLRPTQVANLGAKCAAVTADHVAESVRRADFKP